MDFGVKFTGNRSAVKYTVSLGDLSVAVDWNETKTLSASTKPLTASAADEKAAGDDGMFSLVR